MHIRSLLLGTAALAAMSGICFAPAAEGAGSGAPAVPEGGGGEPELTFGGKRVGVNFNPSQDTNVKNVKGATASIIDQLKSAMDYANSQGNPEAARCFATAMTAYEDAAMWAVKGYTKPKA